MDSPVLYNLLKNRVVQQLDELSGWAVVDANEITRTLRNKWPEYNRRKFAPFRKLIIKIYDEITKDCEKQQVGKRPVMTCDKKDSDDDGDSDCEVIVERYTNIMNKMLNASYAKKRVADNTEQATNVKTAKITTNEPTNAISIDICSSDSNDKTPVKVSATNGAKKAPPATQTAVQAQTAVKGKKKANPKDERKTAQNTGAKLPTRNNQLAKNSLNKAAPQTLKRFSRPVDVNISSETFASVGGMENTLKELCDVLLHIKCPDFYFMLGVNPPRAILLHGPTGCGKTLLAHAIAGQLDYGIIEVPACELISGVSGGSEERIREIFEQAEALAPVVLFLDDIDAIGMNRSFAQKDMERRMVSQLITCLDNLRYSACGQIIVVAATTRPESLDPALRRVGRLEHEIPIGIPSREDRRHILSIITRDLVMDVKLDYDKLAELTPGYVGADLLALVTRATSIAVKRKCLEHMHAARVRAERVMDTVNLDDDDEKIETMDIKDTSNEVKEDPSKITIEEKQTDEAINEPIENVEEVKNQTPEESIIADEVNSKIPEEPIKDDTEMVEKSAESDEISANITATAEEILPRAPTLHELIQWMNCPPEEFTLHEEFCVRMTDFLQALKQIQPAAKREGFATVPDVNWEDVGSLQNIREELQLAVLAPVKYPERLIQLGLSAPSGVLLCGPPGCGKTLLAKAIANEAGINFISVKGPELMSMYVGESERSVRVCFQRARNSAPCVIFFDEFDSLCPKRSSSAEASAGTRIVNQLLTEMDGVEERQGVYILAATNRPDIIDPAILRPGRLDTILYVGLPELEDRVDILKATTKNRKRPLLDDDVDFDYIAERTEGFTGADLAGLVRQAAMLTLKESLNDELSAKDALSVSKRHFDKALSMLRPSVTAQERKIYENLRVKFAAPRTKNDVIEPIP